MTPVKPRIPNAVVRISGATPTLNLSDDARRLEPRLLGISTATNGAKCVGSKIKSFFGGDTSGESCCKVKPFHVWIPGVHQCVSWWMIILASCAGGAIILVGYTMMKQKKDSRRHDEDEKSHDSDWTASDSESD